MQVDLPDIVAEVRAAFDRYEAALAANDITVLDELFWDDPRTIRYGLGENLYGIDAIRAFRAARPSQDPRDLAGTVITAFGRDLATASTLFRRGECTGRQMQSWVRLPAGWRIVAAHVSWLDAGFAA